MRPETRAARWRTRLFVLLLVPMYLALLGTAVYTYLAYRNAASELVMERDRQVTYLSAARLSGELSKFSETLIGLARAEGLLGLDPRPRELALAQASYRLADFDGGVVLLDHFGRVIATQPSRPELLGRDWSDQDVFRRLLATPGTALTNVLPEGINGDKVVALGVPVLGKGGQFAGALVGMFRLGEPTISSFYASIVRLRIGQTGNTYVVDGTGTILFDSSSTLVGQSFAAEVMPGLDLQGEAGAVRQRDVQGRDMVVSFAPIPGTPWKLVTEDDWRSLTSSTRPYANLLLGALVVGMVIPTIGVVVLVRQRDRERLEQERSQQDTQIAGRIQRALLPGEMPLLPGWDLHIHHTSGHSTGRVFHDHLVLPDGRLMISLLHITDTGLTGAISMISGRAVLRTAAQSALEPAEALRRSNDLLCLDGQAERPVHGLFGILDPENSEFRFASAGCESPLLYPAYDWSVVRGAATTLGVRVDHEPSHGHVTVPPGGILILSAGLLEAHNASGETFGLERLRACLGETAGGGLSPLDAILAEAQRFGVPAEAEILILILQRDAEPGGNGE